MAKKSPKTKPTPVVEPVIASRFSVAIGDKPTPGIEDQITSVYVNFYKKQIELSFIQAVSKDALSVGLTSDRLAFKIKEEDKNKKCLAYTLRLNYIGPQGEVMAKHGFSGLKVKSHGFGVDVYDTASQPVVACMTIKFSDWEPYFGD